MSVNNVNPSTLFGGTWQQIEDRFLLSAGSSYIAGNTGGSADAIVPYHNHGFTGSAVTSGAASASNTGDSSAANTGNNSVGHTHTVYGVSSNTTANAVFRFVVQGDGNMVLYDSGNGVHWTSNTSGSGSKPYYQTTIGQHGTTSGISANHTHSMAHTHDMKHTHSVTASGTVGYAGTNGNATGANMPPYLVVYMWKRIS